MKVLDPQSAVLTNAEVLESFSKKRLYPVPKRGPLDAYEAVNLKGYDRIKQDVQHYIKTAAPFTETYPRTELWMRPLVLRLSGFGLTKTEALTIINLGVGSRRPALPQPTEGDDGEGVDEEADEEEQPSEPDYSQILTLIIDDFEERFPGDAGQAKIQEIVIAVKTEIERAQAAAAQLNGTHNGEH